MAQAIDLMPSGKAGAPSPTPCKRIEAPTPIVSCEDDLFGTAATARLLAARIPNARAVIYPEGGHVWLAPDAEVAELTAEFVASSPTAACGSGS